MKNKVNKWKLIIDGLCPEVWTDETTPPSEVPIWYKELNPKMQNRGTMYWDGERWKDLDGLG